MEEATAQTEGELRQLVTFKVADEDFGLDILKVQEIIFSLDEKSAVGKVEA